MFETCTSISIKSNSHVSLISVNTPAFYLIPDAALRVLASGSSKKTGLVVDFGGDVTSVVAVFEGKTIIFVSFSKHELTYFPPQNRPRASLFSQQVAIWRRHDHT